MEEEQQLLFKEEEQRNLVLSATRTTYGSTTTGGDVEEDGTEQDSQDDDDDDDDDYNASDVSFHLGRIGHSTNVFTSMRLTESSCLADYNGDEYEMVPSMLEENIALVLDTNLDPTDKGKLYYSEDAFYNTKNEPHYALTVNVDIYQRILKEVNDSRSVPCGLYFCCHGGDGAHTGASSDDFVDIKMAWLFVSGLFVAMLVVAAL